MKRGTCLNCLGGKCWVLQAYTHPKDLHELSELALLKSRRKTNIFSCPTLSHNLRGSLARWRPSCTLLYRKC